MFDCANVEMRERLPELVATPMAGWVLGRGSHLGAGAGISRPRRRSTRVVSSRRCRDLVLSWQRRSVM